MFWNRSDVTAIEGPLRVPPSIGRAHYEQAWKEFDRLNKFAQHSGPLKWMHVAFDFVLAFGLGAGLKFWHHHRILIVLLGSACLALIVVYSQVMRARFRHWRCPRCHSEWPGTKKEKDSRCRTCGLRLHEMA